MFWTLAFMALVGVTAGVLNFAAAGGSLLPFLVMTMLGVPPLVANATTLAATPASFFRVMGDVKAAPRVMRIPLLCAIGATVIGVWLISHVVTDEAFRRTVPYLLVFSVLLLLGFRHVKDWIDARTRRSEMSPRAMVTTLAMGVSMTSIYAGAFGGGVGVLILTVLTMATSWPWEKINMVKNIICLTTSVVGLVAFAPTGLVAWPLCAVLAVSMVLGSCLGQWVTQHVPATIQRLAVAIMTTASATYLWMTQ